ncbi:hypothetical protein BpHYR1_038477 [Brachionus plicatilis]|uniref:Uncharacterized protein n=1 Tax=Brachionus plicatilis TaxID=10195 RepID=A0A3M7RLN5_BRAPC|nr:hypothetical protein BpHYR1_038477 [Brachionus plicatilis]
MTDYIMKQQNIQFIKNCTFKSCLNLLIERLLNLIVYPCNEILFYFQYSIANRNCHYGTTEFLKKECLLNLFNYFCLKKHFKFLFENN